MPNGKPGDHPYTDIVVHGSSSEFGEDISDFVRALAKRPGFATIREDVSTVLEQYSWGRQEEEPQRLAEVKQRIEALAAQLPAEE